MVTGTGADPSSHCFTGCSPFFNTCIRIKINLRSLSVLDDSLFKPTAHQHGKTALYVSRTFLHQAFACTLRKISRENQEKGARPTFETSLLGNRSRIHDRKISLTFLGTILRVLRLEISVYNVYIQTSFKPLLLKGGGDKIRGDCE